MFFNIFVRKKDKTKEEIDKKCKAAVILSVPEDTQPENKGEDDINIILGDEIKKSKYTYQLTNHNLKE